MAGGRAEGPGALRSSVAAPIVFAAGSVGFYLVTARSRVADFGPDFALRSRYAYVALALLIPIVGVGIEGLRRRSPAVAWVTCGVIVLVLPASLRATSIREHLNVRPATVAAIGHAPWLASIAPDNFGEMHLMNNDLETPYSDQFTLGMRNRVWGWNTSVAVAYTKSYKGLVASSGNRFGDGTWYWYDTFDYALELAVHFGNTHDRALLAGLVVDGLPNPDGRCRIGQPD